MIDEGLVGNFAGNEGIERIETRSVELNDLTSSGLRGSRDRSSRHVRLQGSKTR
jgi:hypothetical protein